MHKAKDIDTHEYFFHWCCKQCAALNKSIKQKETKKGNHIIFIEWKVNQVPGFI